jgi:hypothetical protein
MSTLSVCFRTLVGSIVLGLSGIFSAFIVKDLFSSTNPDSIGVGFWIFVIVMVFVGFKILPKPMLCSYFDESGREIRSHPSDYNLRITGEQIGIIVLFCGFLLGYLM